MYFMQKILLKKHVPIIITICTSRCNCILCRLNTQHCVKHRILFLNWSNMYYEQMLCTCDLRVCDVIAHDVFLSLFYVRLGSSNHENLIVIWVPLLIRCARISSVSCNCLWGLDNFGVLLYCDVSLSSRGSRPEICNWGCCKINLIAKVRDHFHNFLGYTKNAQKPMSIVLEK